jgi:hypothetical protein
MELGAEGRAKAAGSGAARQQGGGASSSGRGARPHTPGVASTSADEGGGSRTPTTGGGTAPASPAQSPAQSLAAVFAGGAAADWRAGSPSPDRRAYSIDIGTAAAATAAADRAVASVLMQQAGGGGGAPGASDAAAGPLDWEGLSAASSSRLELDWLWPPCLPSGQEEVEVAVHLSATGRFLRHRPSGGGRTTSAGSHQQPDASLLRRAADVQSEQTGTVVQVRHQGMLIHQQEVTAAGPMLLRFALPDGPQAAAVTALMLLVSCDGEAGPAQPLLVMPGDAAHDFWGLFSDLLEDELRPPAEVGVLGWAGDERAGRVRS